MSISRFLEKRIWVMVLESFAATRHPSPPDSRQKVDEPQLVNLPEVKFKRIGGDKALHLPV
jgi:hypothetical protein